MDKVIGLDAERIQVNNVNQGLEMIQSQVYMERKPSYDGYSKSKDSKELADVIYIFCPGSSKGICFSDKSPSGVVVELTGTLPTGIFWADGIRIADWDEQVNGAPINDDYTLKDDLFDVYHAIKQLVKGDGSRVQNVITLIVSRETMLSLLDQIDSNVKSAEGNHTVLNLNKKYNLKESFNDNIEFKQLFDGEVNNINDYFGDFDPGNNKIVK